MAAERSRAGARVVCDQLSRRGFRTAEHGVSRCFARAHDQRVRCATRSCARGADRTPRRLVVAARRACGRSRRSCRGLSFRATPLAAFVAGCVGRRRAEARRFGATAAVGRAVRDLHVWNYGVVEGRAVAVSAAVHDRNCRLWLPARRRGHPRESADVPCRRHQLPDDRVDPLRLVPPRGRLQYGSLLGPGQARWLRDDVRSHRHHGPVPDEGAARARTSASTRCVA